MFGGKKRSAPEKRKEERSLILAALVEGRLNRQQTSLNGFDVVKNSEMLVDRFLRFRLKEVLERKTLYRSQETKCCYLANVSFNESELHQIEGLSYVGLWQEAH